MSVRISDLGLVAAGGFVGTLGRYLLGLAIDSPSGFPLAMFAANVSGAFLIGLLVACLAYTEGPRWRSLRLLLGTGVLGGFTSYSALAVGTSELLLDPSRSDGAGVWLALTYGVGTLLAGLVASGMGLLAGKVLRKLMLTPLHEGAQ